MTKYWGHGKQAVRPFDIDGVITADEEWQGNLNSAKAPAKFELSESGPTVYVMNDDHFLYVGFDDVSSDGFASINIFKAGAHTPEQVDAPGIDGRAGVNPGQPFWDGLLDSGDGETYNVAVTRVIPSWLLKAAIASATEFKIPLVNLGLKAGDTIYIGFIFYEHAVVHQYPADLNPTLPLSKYATLTLES